MEFKRLKALYEAGANVYYKGKLCDIIGINLLNETAQIAEANAMFPPVYEVKASEVE